MDFKKRTSNIGFIAYEESMLESIARVKSYGNEYDYYISPLHDKDLKEGSETDYKKPHYHIILHFNSENGGVIPERWFDILNVPKNCAEIVRNLKGYLLYFTHSNTNGKALYNKEEIQTNNIMELERIYSYIRKNANLV